MEKEETHKPENEKFDKSKTSEINEKNEEKKKELTPEEKIKELEDKLARSLAEMENQRRRYEKEKEEAFEYGGYSFAKESLNLIDNLERSKQSLENDETLKKSEALKKISDHLEIIYKDTLNIFNKNNINIFLTLNDLILKNNVYNTSIF